MVNKVNKAIKVLDSRQTDGVLDYSSRNKLDSHSPTPKSGVAVQCGVSSDRCHVVVFWLVA